MISHLLTACWDQSAEGKSEDDAGRGRERGR
jgi:hypothetical protein